MSSHRGQRGHRERPVSARPSIPGSADPDPLSE